LTARLGLTAGVRLESFDDNYADTLAFSSASEDTLQNSELTFEYEIGNAALVYATLSRGEKAGGVNTVASANLPFMQPQFQSFIEPRLNFRTEVLSNREVGYKGRLLDGRLSLRAALFRMERKDAQLESWIWDGVNFLWIGFLDNANGSNSGAEFELDYAFSEGMSFFASLGLLDTEVDDITVFDLDRNEFERRSGIDQGKSPHWQYNFGMSIRLSERMSARVEFEGQDDSRFGYYHDQSIAGYDLLNASLDVGFGRNEVQLWGRNLTDEQYAVHGLYFGNDPREGWINETYYQFGEPRIFGVTFRHRFQ
jgi:iron complex outermembrane receptor protein